MTPSGSVTTPSWPTQRTLRGAEVVLGGGRGVVADPVAERAGAPTETAWGSGRGSGVEELDLVFWAGGPTAWKRGAVCDGNVIMGGRGADSADGAPAAGTWACEEAESVGTDDAGLDCVDVRCTRGQARSK